jgi:predicted nucleic acid-binding protein
VDRALVVNASPLIFLARIDRLDLLASLAKLLVVPEAVIQEIQAGSDSEAGVDERSADENRRMRADPGPLGAPASLPA